MTITPVASHDAPGAPIRVDVSRFHVGPDEIEFGLSLHGGTTDVWTLDTARAALDAIAAAVDTLEREMNAHR
ncbi:hypothetical protein [Rhodococcus sp. NBC_00297]|uniref:hypothetical protein n=1 Tax=Rhodococcus sp. NBC_00297 TaxID=2976005 RepID=UPI002E2A7C5B|nr:hypothetical protein [Rhodococcus sp. NBC_00297]